MAEWQMNKDTTIKLDPTNREGAHCNVYKRGIGCVGRLLIDKNGNVTWIDNPEDNINHHQKNLIEDFARKKSDDIFSVYKTIRFG